MICSQSKGLSRVFSNTTVQKLLSHEWAMFSYLFVSFIIFIEKLDISDIMVVLEVLRSCFLRVGAIFCDFSRLFLQSVYSLLCIVVEVSIPFSLQSVS